MPYLSILVPVYNAHDTLARCVDSVLCQTVSDWELLLVDDGSTDDSAALCAAYAACDARIRVLRQANGGPNCAVLHGLSQAKGIYCGFLDSDDWIKNDMFSRLLAAAEQSGTDGVRCGFCISRQGKPIEEQPIAGARLFSGSEIRTEILEPFFERTSDCTDTWSNSRCAKVYRTACLQKAAQGSDPTLRMGEDLELNLRFLSCCDSVLLLPGYCGYIIFENPASACRRFDASLGQKHLHFIARMEKLAQELGLPGMALPDLRDYLLCSTLWREADSPYSFFQRMKRVRILNQSIQNHSFLAAGDNTLLSPAQKLRRNVFCFFIRHHLFFAAMLWCTLLNSGRKILRILLRK